MIFVGRWDAFHQGSDLKSQVGAYRTRYGFYPEVVSGRHLHGTRGNRRYLKQHSTRFAGKLLGWPKKVAEANREELKPLKAQRHEAYLQRISVEGRFGREKTAID